MKKISFLSGLLLLTASAFSQIESAQMGAEFKEVTKSQGLGGIETYSSGTVKGSQFFSPLWSKGTVTTLSNVVISNNNYSFLYDKVRQQLFIKWRDSSAILLAQKDQIKGFTLNTDRVHNFASAALYDPSNKNDFFEILTADSKGYTLLKLIKAKFEKADVTDIQRVKDGDNYDEFVDEISFYISYNNGVPQKVSSEKSVEKNFPALKQKIEDYYTQSDNVTGNEALLTGLVQSLNN